MRRIYPINITVNQQKIRRVIIDPHYEEKHRDHMNDDLILELILTLDGQRFVPTGEVPSGFKYYRADPLWHDDKPYRLVWCQHPNENYVGVITAFRRRYDKRS